MFNKDNRRRPKRRTPASTPPAPAKAPDQTVLSTITGDLYQPVRLHYRVDDPQALVPAFQTLRCLQYDPPRQRWVWLYDHEASHLRFKRSYSDVPAQLRPVVLGSFYRRAESTLLLDVRSHERAIAAVQFFDQHLSRSVACITEAELLNKLHSTQTGNLDPGSFFDRQSSTVRDPDKLVAELLQLALSTADPQERVRVVMEKMHEGSRQPLPEMERIPVRYHEDGIHAFVNALQFRQLVAIQHWLGNTAFTLADAIRLASNGGSQSK